jgi:hypothetical protein
MENIPIETENNVAPEEDSLAHAWAGKAGLAFVWWEIGIPFNIAAFGLKSQWVFDNVYEQNYHIYAAAVVSVAIAYFLFSVMVWRCSPNVQDKGWKHVARGLIMLGAFGQIAILIKVLGEYAT